jgi:hypothetical protein
MGWAYSATSTAKSWTDAVAPEGQRTALPTPIARPVNRDLLIAGYIFAVFLPILGFIFGLIVLGKGDVRGLAVIILSVTLAFLWFWLALGAALSA